MTDQDYYNYPDVFCSNWAVFSLQAGVLCHNCTVQCITVQYSTIQEGQIQPSGLSSSLTSWCLLVLGELIQYQSSHLSYSQYTVEDLPEHLPSSRWKQVVHLDSTWHSTHCTFLTCHLLDWTDPDQRKNAGFLFALDHGARQVMDLDSR